MKRSYKKGPGNDHGKVYNRTKRQTSNNIKHHLQSSKYQSSKCMHTLKGSKDTANLQLGYLTMPGIALQNLNGCTTNKDQAPPTKPVPMPLLCT